MNRLVSIDGDLDGVGSSRLCKVPDGKDMMLGGEAQCVVAFLFVNIELGVFGPLHLNLSLEIAGVVDIERQQAYGTVVFQCGQHCSRELLCGRGIEGDGLQ